jgi:uncharacterized cupredoxin-like copper-binding protein
MTKLRVVMFGLVATAMLAWAVPAMASTAKASGSTVTVTAGKPSEFSYTLSTKTVATGSVTFKVTNKGALSHTLKVCSSNKGGTSNACTGKGTPMIAPGKSASLTVTFSKPGTYEYLCTVPGHAAAGMKGDLKVT